MIKVKYYLIQAIIIFITLMLSKTIISLFSEAKLQIFKGKYLIKAPPKKTLTSYMLFAQEFRASQTTPTNITQLARKTAESWKNLSEGEKEAYSKKAQDLREKNAPEVQAYEKRFIIPFKNVTYGTLLVQKHFASSSAKKAPIKQMGGELKKVFAQASEETKKNLQEEATKINEERRKVRDNYLIPEKQFATFNSYLRRQQRDNNVGRKSELSSKQLEKLQEKYKAKCDSYNKKLESFAEKHGLTVNKLKKMMEKDEKAKSKKKEEKSEEK